ncbi:MAG: zinc ribbon domain-containing protein [Butyrivibrio sp.]|nr:zinc ribbon domain-containing protein [Butyrivibrio sp.]
MNKKTKLGIAATTLMALIYASGAVSTLAMVVLILYVLLKEDDEELKAATKKAAFVLVIILLISGCKSVLVEALRLFSDDYSSVLYSFANKLDYLVDFATSAVFIVFAFMSMSGSIFKSSAPGPMYQQPMQGYGQPMQQPMQQQSMQQPVQRQPMQQAPSMQAAPAPEMQPKSADAEARKCPKCGNLVGDDIFCTNCGTKV